MLIKNIVNFITIHYIKLGLFIKLRNINSLKFLSLIFIVTISLTGCYNNIDLNEMAIVSAVGIDKTDGGNIKYTVQIVRPGVIKAKNQGSEEESVWVYTTEGETVFSAVRNILTTINRKVFYSHLQLIVISEEIAMDSILDFLDIFERDKEVQKLAYVLIAKGVTAEEVIKAKSELENIPATHIKSIVDNYKNLAKMVKVDIIDLLRCLNSPGYSAVVGVIKKNMEIENETQENTGDNNQEHNGNKQDQSFEELEIKDLKVEGTAIFRRDKLVGYLNQFETRGLLFAINEVESGIINVDNPFEKNKKVAFEIVRSNGKLGVEIKNGQVELAINIKAIGRLGDQQGAGNLTTPEMIEKMENLVARVIEKNIRSAVDRAQKDFHLDYFGFAKILNKNHLSYWKKIENNWSEIFSQLPVIIKVKWRTVNSSLIKEPSVAH